MIMASGGRRTSSISFSMCVSFTLFFGSIAMAPAQQQPNPGKFPTARGVSLPIAEGYWATSKDDCVRLRLTDEIRPHVGLKGFPIANNNSSFWYFSPRLANWPDGLCWVTRIRRDANSRFILSGYCGSEPGDRYRRDSQFSGAVAIQNERQISISAQTVGPVGTYYFCKSVLGPR
jgi:hypothetical protein